MLPGFCDAFVPAVRLDIPSFGINEIHLIDAHQAEYGPQVRGNGIRQLVYVETTEGSHHYHAYVPMIPIGYILVKWNIFPARETRTNQFVVVNKNWPPI
ncbi:hypothetical protein [Atlantibacter subterraneus]|uniref:hypothetical protein n=1 Tax=Atlantibacter subterraneus TaxID=255519 RepID=UPI003F58DCC1